LGTLNWYLACIRPSNSAPLGKLRSKIRAFCVFLMENWAYVCKNYFARPVQCIDFNKKTIIIYKTKDL
jgi:hypothetical protein